MTPAVTLSGGLRGEAITLKATERAGVRTRSHPRWPPSGIWNRAGCYVPRLAPASRPRSSTKSATPRSAPSASSPLEPDRRGNVDLKAEHNVSVELGLEHYWPNETAVVGVNTYLRETEDFIERRQVLEGARWVERPYSEGDARHWGIEFDAKLKTEPLGLKGGALRNT